MNTIYRAFLSCLFLSAFSACIKNADKPSTLTAEAKTADSLFKVSFDINDFSVEYRGRLNGQSLKELAAKDYLKYLYCGVFDTAGNRIHLIQQTYMGGNDASFGKINDSLPAGDYTFVFAGSVRYDSSFVKLSTKKLSDLSIDYQNTYWGFDTSLPDLFYKKLPITVGSGLNANNVKLDRLTGQLEFKFTSNYADTIQFRYDTCFISVGNSMTSFSVFSETSKTVGQNAKIWTGRDLYQPIDMSFLGSSNALTINIFIPKLNGVYRGLQRTITNVHVYPNKKTVLTGSPFVDGWKLTAGKATPAAEDDNIIFQNF